MNKLKLLDIQIQKDTPIFESEVCRFISSLGVQFETNVSGVIKREIDIYIPELKLAFECNSSFWHSELNGKGRMYHANKVQECKELGIHLVHLWEHNWKYKKDIIMSRISSLLGRNRRVFARKCSVINIGNQECKYFFENTHIQGSVGAQVKLGLICEGDIVAMMTFGKSRYSKLAKWELLRYSSSLKTNVVGGASKLLSHFRARNEGAIITYADMSANTGNVYTKIGFTFSHSAAPAYYYTKDYITFENRVKFQKHKLPDMLPIFDINLTEWENMKNNGYDRIWDCGVSTYIIE